MGIFDGYFPLGLGTSRFPISGPGDTAGIEKSISLVRNALDSGINYIDTAYIYSAGMAQAVLKESFAHTKRPFDVTVKVMHGMDTTSDDTRRRTEVQLKAMGIEKARFFYCWTIFSYEEFKNIMSKGGIYEGALKLKDEGLIDHICFSTHAQAPEIIQIIESGAFEGLTLSYNMMNAAAMKPVLDSAQVNGVDIAVMNPLGGGIISQNPDFFDFVKGAEDDNVVQGALRFAKAHPAIKIILSGIASENQISENIHAVTTESAESDSDRTNRIMKSLRSLSNYCTSCGYCTGCPADIPVSEIMGKRNALLFNSNSAFNRTDPELINNIKIFQSYPGANGWFPESPENPCTNCGKCEAQCTQRLGVMNDIKDTFKRAREVGFSTQARKERLAELLADKDFEKVGLYPNGGFANLIVSLYNEFFGIPPFEWIQFNSDPKMWGEMSGGLPIHSPADISTLKPDMIIICTYKYDADIYESLRHYEENGVQIVKLHRELDVPWVF